MVLLKMEQFPRDLNIKEINMINMINITLQKIGIYYKNKEWGKRCFNKIISEIPREMIEKWLIMIMKCIVVLLMEIL